jgi:dienelactone hydrolase
MAIREYSAALALQGLAGGGDGFYFTTEMAARLQIARERRRLYGRLLEISGDRAERLTISHVHGQGPALLHFPTADRGLAGQRLPGMVVMHGLGGIKEDMDAAMAALRGAGLVTLAMDLPAHGECAEGPRLGRQAEQAVIAALETVAARPEIDPSRVGVLGGSLGGFFALRAAAATCLPVACVAPAAPFDVGTWLPHTVPALQDTMAWVLGARSRAECYAPARPLYLGDVLGKVACPAFIGQGTQDHAVHFTTAYEIARRLMAPVTVHPLRGR